MELFGLYSYQCFSYSIPKHLAVLVKIIALFSWDVLLDVKDLLNVQI